MTPPNDNRHRLSDPGAVEGTHGTPPRQPEAAHGNVWIRIESPRSYQRQAHGPVKQKKRSIIKYILAVCNALPPSIEKEQVPEYILFKDMCIKDSWIKVFPNFINNLKIKVRKKRKEKKKAGLY